MDKPDTLEIKPTVGAIVHYWPRTCEGIPHYPLEPLAAIITATHGSYSVNLAVFDMYGGLHPQRVVKLYQPGERPPPRERGYCQWPNQPEKKEC